MCVGVVTGGWLTRCRWCAALCCPVYSCTGWCNSHLQRTDHTKQDPQGRALRPPHARSKHTHTHPAYQTSAQIMSFIHTSILSFFFLSSFYPSFISFFFLSSYIYPSFLFLSFFYPFSVIMSLRHFLLSCCSFFLSSLFLPFFLSFYLKPKNISFSILKTLEFENPAGNHCRCYGNGKFCQMSLSNFTQLQNNLEMK